MDLTEPKPQDEVFIRECAIIARDLIIGYFSEDSDHFRGVSDHVYEECRRICKEEELGYYKNKDINELLLECQSSVINKWKEELLAKSNLWIDVCKTSSQHSSEPHKIADAALESYKSKLGLNNS